MAYEPLTLSIPDHWLPTLFLDDLTPLTEAEAWAFMRWRADMHREYGEFHIGECEHQPHFVRWHDASEYGVKACMCKDVTFMLPCKS